MADESFDTVLDKGALDALMEPEVGTKLGSRYLSEVLLVNKFCLVLHYNWMSVGSNNESCVLSMLELDSV